MGWWSALQMEQVPSSGLLWGETVPHIPVMEKKGKPYKSTVASPTLGAAAPWHMWCWDGLVPPSPRLAPGVGISWQLAEVPGDMSCIFSYCCWTLYGTNCFLVKELQQEFWGNLFPYEKSGFINLLLFTTVIKFLCDNGKKIYSCFL